MRFTKHFTPVRITFVFVVVAALAFGGWLVVDNVTKTERTAGASGPEVAILAPVAMTSSSYEGATTHHLMGNNVDPTTGTAADWAWDWSVPADTSITPSLSGPYGSEYFVQRIIEACGEGREGGLAVVIGVRAPNGGELIGSVAYAHLAGVGVAVDQPVYADTVLGVVAKDLPVDENCWTGAHLHLEAMNIHDYSCFVERPLGTPVAAGEKIGRIGGSDIGATRTSCP